MKLFFETSIQARAFLSAVPLGLMLGVLLNLEACLPGWKALWDILLMLLCAAGLGMLLFWTEEGNLRIYHLLAVGTGLLLYRCGAGCILSKIKATFSPEKNAREKKKKM